MSNTEKHKKVNRLFLVLTIITFFMFPKRTSAQMEEKITFSVANGKIKKSKSSFKYSSQSKKVNTTKFVIKVFNTRQKLSRSKKYVFLVIRDFSDSIQQTKCGEIFDADSNIILLHKAIELDSKVFFNFIYKDNLVVLKIPKTRKITRTYYENLNNISIKINDFECSWKKIELSCNKHLYKTVL
jgi:hypothetical protein